MMRRTAPSRITVSPTHISLSCILKFDGHSIYPFIRVAWTISTLIRLSHQLTRKGRESQRTISRILKDSKIPTRKRHTHPPSFAPPWQLRIIDTEWMLMLCWLVKAAIIVFTRFNFDEGFSEKDIVLNSQHVEMKTTPKGCYCCCYCCCINAAL